MAEVALEVAARSASSNDEPNLEGILILGRLWWHTGRGLEASLWYITMLSFLLSYISSFPLPTKFIKWLMM